MNTTLATLPATSGALTLTPDQQQALRGFQQFLLDPVNTVFVLSGFSGCGKSTLVRTIIDQLPAFTKVARLIDPTHRALELALTATTNKAAENLARITGDTVRTIHAFLGLRVQTDFRTGITTLIPRNYNLQENQLIFIDEASYIDKELLSLIFSRTRHCKVVFVGDPAQLTPVKSHTAPVFNAGFSGAALTQVVRQAEGNPIVELSTQFRHTVNTGEWLSFTPDGHHIQHLDRAAFNAAIEQEFSRPDWRYSDSKILAWTNKCVIGFNHFVRNLVKGDPHFQVGDYAVCNSFINVGKASLKTDQLVEISSISEDCEVLGVLGNDFTMDNSITAFMPKTLESKNARLRKAKAAEDFITVSHIENEWVDLRAAYASTINKSQGSTFDRVFIDLDDVARCNSGDTLARMLYVAVSRARTQVFLTGDLA